MANELILELIPEDHGISLTMLCRRLDILVVNVRSYDPSFDFAYWSRGTLMETINFLKEIGLIVYSGTDGQIQRTAAGTGYLEEVRKTMTENAVPVPLAPHVSRTP